MILWHLCICEMDWKEPLTFPLWHYLCLVSALIILENIVLCLFLELISFRFQISINNNTSRRQISLCIPGLYSSYKPNPVFPFLRDFHSCRKIVFISVCSDVCFKFINKRQGENGINTSQQGINKYIIKHLYDCL